MALALSAPPVLAVAVKLHYDRTLRGMGWRPGKPRYLWTSYHRNRLAH